MLNNQDSPPRPAVAPLDTLTGDIKVKRNDDTFVIGSSKVKNQEDESKHAANHISTQVFANARRPFNASAET
jgi:hypothetical protein